MSYVKLNQSCFKENNRSTFNLFTFLIVHTGLQRRCIVTETVCIKMFYFYKNVQPAGGKLLKCKDEQTVSSSETGASCPAQAVHAFS